MRIIVLIMFLICMTEEGCAKNYRINCPVEIDSLLVAWLIDRYVDDKAEFALTTKEQISQEEDVININTSDSPYRRDARHTAFDIAVTEFGIQNSCIEMLQRHAKILEIMPWRKLEHPDTQNFERALTPRLPVRPDDDGLQQSFAYIDHFCASGSQTTAEQD